MSRQLQKYLSVLKLAWQNGLVYRTSLLMWRLRQFLSSVMALTIWSAIFTQQTEAFSYSGPAMISYIFVVAIAQSLILATVLHGLTGTIYSGQLSYELLKPVNIFAYLGAQDLADKLKNLGFVLIEMVVLFFIFKPILMLPTPMVAGLSALTMVMGALIHFFILLLFGAIGFWSSESWGPRFLFFMFIDFTAGKLYPLDILPHLIQRIIYLTPFPYLSYVQTQLFLERISLDQAGPILLVMGGWLIGLGALTYMVWKVGIRNYQAMGQ